MSQPAKKDRRPTRAPWFRPVVQTVLPVKRTQGGFDVRVTGGVICIS